jgi:hypothetical protein
VLILTAATFITIRIGWRTRKQGRPESRSIGHANKVVEAVRPDPGRFPKAGKLLSVASQRVVK